VDKLEEALAATSDRYSVLALAVFGAVVAGLAVGLAVALLRANRRARHLLA
jgi:uncharacterized protein involved in exopolysaccharide biosynthesis